MKKFNFSNVEKYFYDLSGIKEITTKTPYITVQSFPQLGLLTSLRFLEWVSENPDGVISLPTGKTPEHFISWTKYFLENWSTKKAESIREKFNFTPDIKPKLSGLHFVQIDEFYPIKANQHNSFFYYVNKYYINGFNLDRNKALLINSEEIPLAEGKHFNEIFPDGFVDLSLRYSDCKTDTEKLQQESIFKIDDWCTEYENKIRALGGIGFFLGGIGPDGHIAFNTRGSDFFSTTRLTSTNFETQAVAAGDLGGIEISRNRLVITIGLSTITYNPHATAIIIAAGEAKSQVVKDALEANPANMYPATSLQKLNNARFYLTNGAAVSLTDSIESYYKTGEWTHEKSERAVIDLCKKIDKYGFNITIDDLKDDKYCQLIPGLNKDTVGAVVKSISAKIDKGLMNEKNQVYYHTGPHHDDIMLGILPHINRQLRDASNDFHFAVMTSGFTAVTNDFLKKILQDTKSLISFGKIEMLYYKDFFEEGYKFKRDKDVYHYLNKVAADDPIGQRRGLCHRIVRAIVDIFKVSNIQMLTVKIDEISTLIENSYDGEKNPPDIQKLKGMIREFEEELVWAHFGIQVKNVHHLRLGFYTGDIFTEQPERTRDVLPILDMLRTIKPTVISLALDPEGSGPDTHYKVLQAIAEAIKLWSEEEDISKLRVWGYRNVWYRFHPAEANVIVPVSVNSMSVLNEAFSDCYVSQVNASFPSYMYDGKFSKLTQRIWVDQLKDIQLLIGKKYFYMNADPKIRVSHGLLYFKEMTVDEFFKHSRMLEEKMEGIVL